MEKKARKHVFGFVARAAANIDGISEDGDNTNNVTYSNNKGADNNDSTSDNNNNLRHGFLRSYWQGVSAG